MNSLFTYTAQSIHYKKKEGANEIQLNQKNYFLFNTSGNAYILCSFYLNQIDSKWFLPLIFVASGIILLVHS